MILMVDRFSWVEERVCTLWRYQRLYRLQIHVSQWRER